LIGLISYIKGTVEHMTENAVVIECGGIGYHIAVSAATLSKISGQHQIKIYTYMQVKEDGIALFGFFTSEEIDMFHKLISVSGLGPKSALGMLSAITPSQIMLAIVTDDIAALSKAPGVGKKTAQRMILELKDKVKTEDAVAGMAVSAQESLKVSSGAKQDATDALLALGYSRSEAVRAVMEIAVEGLTAEQIIKNALRKLNER
jgi:Holliday junction DNA helicase RuvA